ncbi:MAG: hypothetical protein FD150_78 [Rhodobacteraceae bacterium]|nr:MAG: hypothetical protein FD150_78 [Paracoccaceae bacterium]
MASHTAMQIPTLAASNRIGSETAPAGPKVAFCGSSFIAGQAVAKADRKIGGMLADQVDLDAMTELRGRCGPYRGRRPVPYEAVGTLDGRY